jgi:hypothetical protein
MSYPNYNLVSNCASLPRCFSSLDLQDGKCPFHWNGPENLITLIPMDDILLEVRNRKERCCAWSLVAMTTHIRTFSMLFFARCFWHEQYFFHSKPGYTIDVAYMSPTSIEYTLAPCYHQTSLHLIVDDRAVLHIKILAPPLRGSNLGMRFLLRGKGCNTPCYGFANYHLNISISSLTTHQILG